MSVVPALEQRAASRVRSVRRDLLTFGFIISQVFYWRSLTAHRHRESSQSNRIKCSGRYSSVSIVKFEFENNCVGEMFSLMVGYWVSVEKYIFVYRSY